MTEKFTLSNGLAVVIEEMPHVRVAALQCGFKIGSIYEDKDEGGICHLIEHMLFKGCAKWPKAGQVASAAEALGADINAFTSFENTVYHMTLSSHCFADGLEILANMVRTPRFDAKELEREKEVVCEEIRRGKDQPSRVVSELLFDTAFKRHPYRKPIIGTEKSVKSWSAQKLKSFYREWYGPQNAVVVVASNLPHAEVLKQIKRYFESWRGARPKHPVLPQEKRPESPRFGSETQAIAGTYLEIAWPGPAFSHPDAPLFDLLSHILGEGESSRLEIEVKEKKRLVQAIHSYAYTPKYPGLFGVGALCQDEESEKALEAILEEVHRLKAEGPTEAELKRARLNLESSRYYEKQSVDGVAGKIMFFECTTGDHRDETRYYERIAQAEPEQIKRIAELYLEDRAVSIAMLSSQSPHFSLAELPLHLPAAKTQSASPAKASAPRPYLRKTHAQELTAYTLQNGVRVFARPTPALPILALRAGVLGGTYRENTENNGAHNLIASLLTKGTFTRSAETLAIATEEMAGSLYGFAGRHSLGIAAQMWAKKQEHGLAHCFDALLNPVFLSDEVEKERFLALEAIRQEEDHPASLLWKHFFAALFPHHPYGLPVIGTKESVTGLSAKKLAALYHAPLSRRELVISLVGDFDPDAILPRIEALTASLPEHASPVSPLPHPPCPSQITRKDVSLKKAQAHIALGFHGASLKSKDRHALSVLNTVLAGQGGRLFLTLRDRESLAYTVTSTLMTGIDPGYFALYIACDPKKVDAAIAGMLRELEKISDDAISEKELKRAIHQLASGYEIDHQRYANSAAQLFSNALYGLPLSEYHEIPERYRAVTREDVRRVARHYITLKAYTLCVLAP